MKLKTLLYNKFNVTYDALFKVGEDGHTVINNTISEAVCVTCLGLLQDAYCNSHFLDKASGRNCKLYYEMCVYKDSQY